MSREKFEEAGKKKEIKVKYCPKCKDVEMVMLKSGQVEVFECENCKFKVEKKK